MSNIAEQHVTIDTAVENQHGILIDTAGLRRQKVRFINERSYSIMCNVH